MLIFLALSLFSTCLYNNTMELPESFLQEMKDLLKQDYPAYLDAMNRTAYSGLRVNTLKTTPEAFSVAVPFHLEPVSWCSEGFACDRNDDVSRHPFYHAGLYYLQEPSAMAPAAFLPVDEGDLILDACSAPGGKATALAGKLSGTGLLVSNDISSSRQHATLRNLERAGAKNIYVTAESTSALAQKYPATFDKILVDAPCSGEGMFRKDPSLISSWLSRGSEWYPPVQKQIASDCLKMLAPGGMMLYSTCTFSRQENEETIEYLLSLSDDIELVSIHHESFAEGIGLSQCARLYPHRLHGEGHFLAMLRRSGNKPPRLTEETHSSVIKNASLAEFLAMTDLDMSHAHLKTMDQRVLLVPDIPFNNEGIRTLRSGLLLGTIHRDIFEPSQPLAMALKKSEFANTVSFSADDPRVLRYLKGETVEVSEGTDGWILVCVEDYPLGFAKKQKNRLKNKLDSGWRIQ